MVTDCLSNHTLNDLVDPELQRAAMRAMESLFSGFKVRTYMPNGTFEYQYDYELWPWETCKEYISSTW